MLLHLDLTKILFLDIETVPQLANYSEMDDETRISGMTRQGSFLSKNKPERKSMNEQASMLSSERLSAFR